MFKLIAAIFLAVQVAIVIGLMKIDDLPQEIANCMKNTVVPAIHLRESAVENCKTLLDDELIQCQENLARELNRNRTINKCLDKLDDLPLAQRKFGDLFVTYELRKNEFSKLQENMRDCLDSVKPMAQRTFQRGRDCESLRRADDPGIWHKTRDREGSTPYEDCLNEVIADITEDPQALKCIQIAKTMTSDQKRLSEAYLFRVVFNQ